MTGKKNAKVEPKQEETGEVKDSSIDYENMTCGYVMPIANTTNYKLNHWNDVVNILNEVCKDIGFKTHKLVSNTLESNVIHASIVSNLFNDNIVICDVSSKNPNVMFELGMRIAFDKPVIIIKDDSTDYCFDTGIIEHINYPKELRYDDIKSFQVKLRNKIVETLMKQHESPNDSPILEQFGKFSDTRKRVNIPEMTDIDILKSEMMNVVYSINNKVNQLSYLYNDKNRDSSLEMKRPRFAFKIPSSGLFAFFDKFNLSSERELMSYMSFNVGINIHEIVSIGENVQILFQNRNDLENFKMFYKDNIAY